MLSAFFTAHLFMEFASSQNKYLPVEMFKELLLNCYAKELKGVKDEFNDSEVLEYNKFQMLENFQKEFSMSMRERGENFSEGRDASNESQNISDRSQIIYQDIKNIIEDFKNTLRSKRRTFAPPETRPIPSWDLEEPENLEEAANFDD